MDSDNDRSIDTVNQVLNLAKLSRTDLLPTSQALFFARANHNGGPFQLLELNSDLLKCIENKESLIIKGCDNDDVVICTDSATFHVTCAETSNSLLLVKPSKSYNDIESRTEENVLRTEVFGIFQTCLETNVGTCSLKRLYELLEPTVYKGPEHESDINVSHLFTLDQLKNVIQMSDAELAEALNSVDIFEIGGYIRKIEFEYHFRVLSYMLKLIEENSWELDGVDYEITCEYLHSIVPEEIIECLFKKYTVPSQIVAGTQLYRYKEDLVCQFFARVILRTAEKFNLEEFLQAWTESVPEGMHPTEDMLQGIAVINRKSSPKVIWEFQESDLPDNIEKRFKALFEAKEKWTVPEIAPYIRRLATSKLDVNALLAKHARASTVDGVKYYSAKHMK